MKGSDLRDGIVRVLSRDRQQVLGTGFHVTDTLVVTCSHVLDGFKDAERGAIPLEVLQHHEVVTAKLRPELSSPEDEGDFAFLELNRKPRGAFRVLPLGESARSADHRFTVFGFPQGNEDTGTWAHGVIGYATGEGPFRKLLLLESNIREGFSGGPLFDEHTRRVVGVVRFKLAGQGLREAYATPTELLVERCPELRTSEDPPYMGLASFREDDARFWKGRGRVLSEELLPRLKKLPRFVEVSGPSGCGKSSLLYAGLVPALKEGTFIPGSERWDVRAFRPGLDPFVALDGLGLPAGAEGAQDLVGRLRRWREEHPEQDARLVLVIDQLEDLLLRGDAAEEALRQRFLQQLASLEDAALPVTCVVALREGFDVLLSQRAPTLRSLLGVNRVQVPSVLTPDELRDIIAGPAREVGLRFEPPEMVETISQAAQQEFPAETGVGARATVLPLLEVTMTQLWRASRDGTVTLGAFNASTGLLGMLARWADGVYESLEASRRKLADRLLLELVQFGEENDLLEDKGRRVPIETLRERLGGHAEVDAVLQVLVDGRLLVTARDGRRQQDTVELIHDALLTHWKHFADLRSGNREFRRWYTEVQKDASRWEEASRDARTAEAEERLLRGMELATARAMLEQHPDEASALTTRFITRSLEAEQGRQQEKQTRELRERDLTSEAKRNRWLALAATVTAVIVLLVGLIGPWWGQQASRGAVDAGPRTEDETREREALRRARVSGADEVVNLTRRPGFEAEALAKAIELARPWLPGADPAADEVTGALLQALSAFLYSAPLSVGDAAPSDNPSAPGEPPVSLPGRESMLVAVFSPDGQHVVTRSIPEGSRRLVTRVWQVENGAMLRELDSRELCPAGCTESDFLLAQQQGRTTHSLGFSPSPKDASLWLGGADGTLMRWSRDALSLPIPRVHKKEITAVSFSASGARVLTASLDGTAQLWNTETGNPEGAPLNHLEPCEQAVLSPDGRYALVAGLERTTLFDTTTGSRKSFPVGGRGPTLGFSSSGKLAALGDSRVSGRLLVWNVQLNREQRLLQGALGGHVHMPFFSEDECGVIGFDRDAMSAQEHELCQRPASRRVGATGGVSASRAWTNFAAKTLFLPDGTRQQELSLYLWKFERELGRSPPLLFLTGAPPDLEGEPALLSPGKRFLLAAMETGLERRAFDIDLSRYRIPIDFTHHRMPYPSDFSPDLRWIVSLVPDSGDLRLVDVETDSVRVLGSCPPGTGDAWTSAFSRDGRLAVACGGGIWLWDLGNALHTSLTATSSALAEPGARRAASWMRLVFSPDGRQLLTLGPEAKLWSAPDRRVLRELGPLSDAAFSDDGGLLLLVGAGPSKVVSVQRTTTGEELCRSREVAGLLAGLELSWKQERFILQRQEGAAILGSTRSCQFLPELSRLSGERDVVRFSPDGARFATLTAEDGAATLWDSTTGAKLHGPLERVWSGFPEAVAFSPDSRLLFLLSSADTGGSLMVLDALTGARVPLATLGLNDTSGVHAFGFTPDGSRLIVVGKKSVRIIETSGWTQVAYIDLPEGRYSRLLFAGHLFGLRQGGTQGGVQLWSSRDGRRFGTLHGALMWSKSLWNPAGDRIAMFDIDEVRFFSLRRDDLLRQGCLLMRGRPEYARLREHCEASGAKDLQPAATPTP